MCKYQRIPFLVSLFLALALAPQSFAQAPASRPAEASEPSTGKAVASRVLDLDLIAQAEQRAETMRAKLLTMQMQEIDFQAWLEDLDYQLQPDRIQAALAFVGSVRPMDELRDGLRTRLENEKARVMRKRELLIANRDRLEEALKRAEAEIERLRQRLNSL